MRRITIRGGLSLLILTFILVLASGCSAVGGNSVVGTWKQDASQGATSAITLVTFRPDGTGSYRYDSTTPGYSAFDFHASYSFTWKMTDSSVPGASSKTIQIIPVMATQPAIQMDYFPGTDTLTMATSLYEFKRTS